MSTNSDSGVEVGVYVGRLGPSLLLNGVTLYRGNGVGKDKEGTKTHLFG